MVTPLRIVMFGTPDFAVPTLEELLDSPHDIVAVVTQPDRPRGRGRKLTPSPVKAVAQARHVPVWQPDRMRDESFVADMSAARADLGVVAAYGKILPQRVLDIPRLGMINVHASLLPRWRGAAPIHRAVLAGDQETGITIMRVVLALDAGPMLARATVPIGPNQTSAELTDMLARVGGSLLRKTVDQLSEGTLIEEPQDESGVTYAHRLERQESDLDWAQAALAVHNQIRGLQPWPMAASRFRGERVLLIGSEVAERGSDPAAPAPGTLVAVLPDALVVAAGPGLVRITRLQPEGRGVSSARDFINGRQPRPGEVFARVGQPA